MPSVSHKCKDIATVKPKEFEIIRHVGSGNFSNVFQIKFNKIKTDKEYYAVKKILKSEIQRLHKEYEPIMEKHCLFKLHNEPLIQNEYDARDTIVKLHYVFQDQFCLYLVMDFYSNSHMWEMTRGLGVLDPILARYWIGQLVNAVEFCHNHGIVHRDLKAENILMNDECKIKLIDFGTAIDLHRPDLKIAGNTTRGLKRKTYLHFVGTAHFMSPEAVKNQDSGRLTDLWSLGCTIFQILVGIPPFEASSDFLVHLLSRKAELEFPPDFDPDAENLIRSLIQIIPEDRLGSHDIAPFSLASVKAHPYFSGVDFTQLDHLIAKRAPYPSLYASCLLYMSKHWEIFRPKWIEAQWITPELQLVENMDFSSNDDVDSPDKPWLTSGRYVNLNAHSENLLKCKLDVITKSLLKKGIRRVLFLKHQEEMLSQMSWDSLVQDFLQNRSN